MGFSFTMEGRDIALDTPEQVDKMVQFLRLYQELSFGTGGTATAHTPAATPAQTTTPGRKRDTPPTSTETTGTGLFAPDRSPIPPPGQRISDFAAKVLAASGEPMSSPDLAAAMLGIGWESRADNEIDRAASVNTALLRYKDRFAKSPEGLWSMVDIQEPPSGVGADPE
jgi:hypothetical protein